MAVAGLAGWIGCGPADPVEEAKTLISEGRGHAARVLLEPVVRTQRDNFDAQFYYGQALTMVGEPGLAEWSLRRAMKSPDRRRQAALMIVNNDLMGNNPRDAVKILNELIEESPDDIEFLLARAEAYAKTRVDIENVLADVERVREIDPTNLDAHRAEIIGYLEAAMTEEATEALAVLGERIKQEPDSEAVGAWYCTTMALFAKESLDEELARERFDACVDDYPASISVVLAATDFLRGVNETERAIEVIKRAMELNEGKQDPGLTQLLADLYFGEGRFDEAEALLVEGSKVENLQTSMSYKFKLATFYDRQGRLDEALMKFEEAAAVLEELDSLTGEIKFFLADLAIRADELDRALEVAAELDHPPFRLMVEARVAQEREEHVKALALYDEAARLWPDNEFARYHAARSAEQVGDFDGAIELYRHTTRIAGDATDSMTRIAVLNYANGRLADALDILRLQEQRAPLDEIGERLKVEIMVLGGHLQPVANALAKIPPSDRIGLTPRLAAVFRALRLRKEPAQAIAIAKRMNPSVFLAREGGRALEELARTAEPGSESIDQIASIVEAAIELDPMSAGPQAARGVLAEQRGEDLETIGALYLAALELDPDEPIALLGRARSLVSEDLDASLALGKRALEARSVDTERVTELALKLREAGGERQAVELCQLVLRHTPYDGVAAELLATSALAKGDISNTSLDFARRAARFARSNQSVSLLRDLYSARGEQALADEITEWLSSQNERTDEMKASASSGGPDAS